jgi:hypothetical protein
MKFGLRNSFVQALPGADWNPLVFVAPQDTNRTSDFGVSGFYLIGIFLTRLRDLTVERSLTYITKPRLNEGFHFAQF